MGYVHDSSENLKMKLFFARMNKRLLHLRNGSIEQADKWLNSHIYNYVKWANTYNSLLIVTWDDDDGLSANQIPTIFVGPMVRAGKYNVQVNH